VNRACHVVVGTTGRVLDLLQRGTLRLGSVRLLVLDEADKLLAGKAPHRGLPLPACTGLLCGFAASEPAAVPAALLPPFCSQQACQAAAALPDCCSACGLCADSFSQDTLAILAATPQRRQLLALSATFAPAALGTLRSLMGGRQQEVLLCAGDTSLLGVRQFYKFVGGSGSEEAASLVPEQQQQQQQQQQDERPSDSSAAWLQARMGALQQLLSAVSFQQAVVFCKYRSGKWAALCPRSRRRAAAVGLHCACGAANIRDAGPAAA
jgi:hypothetical protein